MRQESCFSVLSTRQWKHTHTNASMKVGYTHHMSIILSWIDAQLDFDQFDFISLAFPDASSPSARAFNTWEVLNDEGRWQEVPLAIMARPVPPQLSWPGPWPRPYEFLAGASFSPGKMITCGFAIKQWNLNLCQVCFTYMFVVSVVCRHSIHSLGSSWCMMCLVMPNMPSCKYLKVMLGARWLLLAFWIGFFWQTFLCTLLVTWPNCYSWVSGKTHRIHGIAQMPVSIRFQLHTEIETKKPFSWIHWFDALDLLLKFHMVPTRLHWNLGTSGPSPQPQTHQPPFIPPKPQAFWRFKPPFVPSTVAPCRLS